MAFAYEAKTAKYGVVVGYCYVASPGMSKSTMPGFWDWNSGLVIAQNTIVEISEEDKDLDCYMRQSSGAYVDLLFVPGVVCGPTSG